MDEKGNLNDPVLSDALTAVVCKTTRQPWSGAAILRHARRFAWEVPHGQPVEPHRKPG